MNLADLCLFFGIVVLVLGAFSPKVSEKLHAKRRWLYIIGAILVIVSLILGLPDFVKGWREGL